MLAARVFDKPAYKWWVFCAVAFGTLTSVINHGGMSVALPTIAQYFDADLAAAQWVVVAEGLAISALILPMGRLSDVIGRKTVYLAGMAIFAAAALLAAGSQSILMLIAFKAVQGVGAAMTQGTGMAMITSVFPAEERGKGIGTHASVVGTGGVLGPVAGGLLITALDWRWLFYVNVVMGVLAILLVVAVVRSRVFGQDTRNRSYDFPGAALSTAVLVTFLLAVSNGATLGWTSAPILAAGVGFVVLLAAFIWWESRAPSPMLDLGTVQEQGLRHRNLHQLHVLPGDYVGAVSAARSTCRPRSGTRPRWWGLVLLPNAASRIVMGPVSGWLSDRYGWRPFNVIGLLLSAAGLFTLASMTASSTVVVPLVGIVLHSAGSGLFQSPNSASIFSAADPSRHGVVAAFVNLSRNAGNVTGIAIAASIVTAVMSSQGFEPNIDAVLGAESGSRLVGSFMTGAKDCVPGDGGAAVDRGGGVGAEARGAAGGGGDGGAGGVRPTRTREATHS